MNNGGGFVGENATIINAEDSRQINYRAGTVAKIAEPDYATASGPFVRVTPALLLRTLNDRIANAHLSLPSVGPIPPAVPSTATFADALARLDVKVKKIVSAHSPRVATMDDLKMALEAETFQASR